MSAKLASLVERTRKATQENGLGAGAAVLLDYVIGNAAYYYYRAFKSSRHFTFQGNRYRYFCHKFNKTWTNERAVEIPIVLEAIKGCDPASVLEIGNVLINYIPARHDVVDKYDQAPHVICQDVVDYSPARPYKRIVTISTLEHVGWDETPRDPRKAIRAVENLGNCLAPGGNLTATIPLGYNSAMDAFLRNNEIPFTQCYYMKRVSRGNRWVEVSWNEVEGARYDAPYHSANALAIGLLRKDER